MRENKTFDLTEGGILQKLLLITMPIMATQFMQMAYNLTDMFWLGRVGSGAVAAAGTAGLFLWFSAGVMILGKVGCEIGVSHAFGRRDIDTAKEYTQNAVFLGAVAGILFSAVLMIGHKRLIRFFQLDDPSVIADAESYLFIVACSIPFTYVAAALSGAFTASGNSRTPFFLSATGLIVNIALDPILIIKFEMGVKGAAIATTGAQFVVFVCTVIAVKLAKSRPFPTLKLFTKPQREKIVQILRWTIPISMETIFFCFLCMVTSRFEASFGSGAVAVSRVGAQIESLSWLVGGGFSSALVAFIGQNYGAGKNDRIQKGVRIALLCMGIWGSLVAVTLAVPGEKIFALFLPDESLYQLGREYLLILAVAQLPMCLESVAGGAFRGMGRGGPPAVVSITTNAIRVVAAYFLSRTSLGVHGIWIVISFSAIVRCVWSLSWYALSRRKMQKNRA